MRTLLLLIGLCGSLSLNAQFWEAGLTLGGANYFGDLSNNSNSFYFQEFRPGGGLFLRYNLTDKLHFKASGNYMRIAGEDANSNIREVTQRNLSFRSSLIEVAVTAEWNIMGYEPYGMFQPFSPYLFAGIGGTHFTPQAELNGEWVNLAGLGTEGQGLAQYPDRSDYSQMTLVIPFGVGAKYALNDNWNLGLELGLRATFTDYLDDVSGSYVSYQELLEGNGVTAATLGNRTGELNGTGPVTVATGTPRGDTNSRDWYVFIGLSISKNFVENGLMGNRKRNGGRNSCYD